MRARKGLIAVVKTVRAAAHQPLRRKYWVRTKNAVRKISPLRARMADAAGFASGLAVTQVSQYAGRKAGSYLGAAAGTALSPFLTPMAIPIGARVGGFIGSLGMALATRPIASRVANYSEQRVAGGKMFRKVGGFWLRGLS